MSRLVLPKLESPPSTIFEHLIVRFPHVSPSSWRSRVLRGLVTLSDGTTLREDSPYRHGVTVLYRREVPFEPECIEDAQIVYRDDNIMIVDKPHGMPVTAAGSYVERSLLMRLEKSMGLTDLAPIHRLDRETAGLLLIAMNPAVRGSYHRLFSERTIQRQYFAVGHVANPPVQRRWRVENRIDQGDPWFKQRIVEGTANAITEVELIDFRPGIGVFRLRPQTGKKHQLRLHMASLGFPIVGDPFYPTIRSKRDGEGPMQLLAKRLEFNDPLSGAPRCFTSDRQLRDSQLCDVD